MPMKKVLGLCEAAGLPFVNHAFSATSLTLAGHMHVMATSPSCFLGMQGHPDYLADDYVTPALDYRDGLMGISDRPGLGVELVDEKVGDRVDSAPVDESLLGEEAERELESALGGFAPSGDLEADFAAAAELAPVVEGFFEDVLVMDPDEAVRANRLRLLRDLRDKVGTLGDFSQIPR